MEQFEERNIAGLTVRIDRHLCVGFGDCIDVAPDGFALDDEGIAVFLDEAGELSREVILAAIESCPVDAIEVVEDA